MGDDRAAEGRRLLLARLAPIFEVIAASGGEAAAVGGAVRDTFLGRQTSDIDVATSLPPKDVLAAFPNARATGLAFGTVTVHGAGYTCHITTYRSEGGYRDARHPDVVEFGKTLEEDLARRDFTMNAMALLPDGGIVDPFGGREDIAHRLIRAVGDARARFAEDALRMLRALRFESELCFLPDGPLAEALLENALLIVRVSGQRLWPEVERLLLGPCAERAIERGMPVLRQILPAIRPRPLASLGDDAVVRLCGLCVGAPPCDLKRRLEGMAAGGAAARRAARLLRFLAEAPKEDPYALRKAATAAGEEDLAALAAVAGGTWAMARAIALAGEPIFRLAVTGRDVERAAGRPPGPWVGEMLSRLWDVVWHDPTKNNRVDLLEEVQNRLRRNDADREG